MCRCPKIHFYEVEFKLDGLRSIAYHKNCGDPLSDAQVQEFDKQLIKLWGLEVQE